MTDNNDRKMERIAQAFLTISDAMKKETSRRNELEMIKKSADWISEATDKALERGAVND